MDVEVQENITKMLEAAWTAQQYINTIKEQLLEPIKVYVASKLGLLVISNGDIKRVDFTENGVHFRFEYSILPGCEEYYSHVLPIEYFENPIAYLDKEYRAEIETLNRERQASRGCSACK